MPTIHALYQSYSEARQAVRALHRAGIGRDDISILANRSDEPEPEKSATAGTAEAGADIGAIAGGAGGVLTGLGLVAIPGLGPLMGAGWLAAGMIGFVGGAAAGLAVGGIAGALVEAGVPHDRASIYADGVQRGGTLVVARISGDELPAAEAALDTVATDFAEERARASSIAGPQLP
jgi:hypothetical protein